MNKVLLSCIAFAAGASIAMAQDEPVFPEKLAFTLNGQKELAGVTAEQTYDQVWHEHNFTVTGICDADQITIEFETPEGWDGIVTPPTYSIFGKSPKTRGEDDWDPLESVLKAGWTESNSITFNVDGMEHNSSIMFVKGDKVYNTMLGISFNVDREGGVVLPEYPASVSYTLNGEKEIPGLTVTQGFVESYGEEYLTIHISGECEADELTFEMVTPDGWDGMLIQHDNWSGEDDNDMWMKAKAPAKEGEDYWMPMMFASWIGATEGNSITFPVDGDEYKGMVFLVKGDQFYTIQIDIISDVAKAGGNVSSDEPKFPERLDFTMNGAKELEGVEAKIEADGYGGLTMRVTGKSDAETIALTFAVPEGWDGWIINADWAEVSEQPVAKTRGEGDWMPLEFYLQNMGFVKGNTVTFAVEEEDNYATLALYKGDQVYNATIDIRYNVVPAGGGSDLVIPSSYVVTPMTDGIEVSQEQTKYGYEINVKGEINENYGTIVIDVPEGWDGFISDITWSNKPEDGREISITESQAGSKNTRAEEAEEIEWKNSTVDEAVAAGWLKGNKFTFPSYWREQTIEVHLYKEDKITDYSFNILINVDKGEEEVPSDYPDFPETYDVTLSCEGPEVTQGPDMIEWTSVYVINVDGECTENELTVTVAVPEGWDGFYGKIDEDSEEDEAMTGTRGNSEWSYWFTPEELEEFGITGLELGNKLTFNVDGESHTAQLYLTKGGKIAYYPIILNVNVKKYVDPELLEANQAAYNAVIDKIEAVEANYEDAVNQIKEVNPDFDFSMYEEIPQQLESYKGWAAQALAAANDYGEEYQFAFDGEEFDNFITMMLAEGTPAPEMPKYYDVTVSDTTLAVTQGEEQGVYTINVEGKTKDETVTVTVAVPEGFDGFIGISDSDFTGEDERNPLNTRADDEEASWVPVELIESFTALKPCTELTFNVDGEEHYGTLMLVKGKLAWSEHIEIVVNVTKNDSSAVEGIEAVDSDAAYFDLQGNRIVNPAKGMYIKVLDGKASKVVVK
ncbi:MAG: hypothetical protein K2K45_09905 [Muribaculaceae bacterium]|nr:hypothetical protein [Muribaculaceae bacterium]